jgi:hypothetical protein
MSTTTTAGKDWDNKELGCLWSREAKASKEKYLTGTINLKSLGFDKDVQLVIFKNKGKSKETHPDLRIYISEKKTESATAKPAATKPAATVQKPTPAPTPDVSDLI